VRPVTFLSVIYTTDAHGRVWETWRSPAGERIRSFTIITTKPNKLCAELHNRRVPALATARQYFRHLD
jgi:putative SOS response-associated peptidase YedK